jgi:hypothetical protein
MPVSAVISREVLRDSHSRDELGYALADILNGIRREWGLTLVELSNLLGRPHGTVKGWLKEGGYVGLDSALDPNTQSIIDFIDIYNMTASFFVKTADQSEWFKTPSAKFDGKSPMAMISENPHNMMIARQIISRMLNP